MILYSVNYAGQAPAARPDWDDPAWGQAETLQIDHFRPESSAHHPRTQARLLYDAADLYGIFRVEDRYVRCVHTRYLDRVWVDSCVEFFVQPAGAAGYFNFEMNCGGALLSYYVTDPTRVGDDLAEYTPLAEADAGQVGVYPSLPPVIDPERSDPLTWTLGFRIPFAVLARYAGPLAPPAGQDWRANLYKCAEENSHPHWAAWASVDELNFHLPRCFGTIRLAMPAGSRGV